MKPWIKYSLQLYKSAIGLTYIQEAGSKTVSIIAEEEDSVIIEGGGEN
jgi:hypothetical protein